MFSFTDRSKSLGRLLTRLVLLGGQQVWTDFVYLTCVEGLKEHISFEVIRRFLLDSECQSSMLMAAATQAKPSFGSD